MTCFRLLYFLLLYMYAYVSGAMPGGASVRKPGSETNDLDRPYPSPETGALHRPTSKTPDSLASATLNLYFLCKRVCHVLDSCVFC